MEMLPSPQKDRKGRFLPGHVKLGGEKCALTHELADEIAIRISEGQSNREVSEALGINFWTLLTWIYRGENEDHRYLQDRVKLAREAQADSLVAYVLEQAKNCPPNVGNAAAVRELATFARWITSVWCPKRYSKNATPDDGLALNVGVAVYLPPRKPDDDD